VNLHKFAVCLDPKDAVRSVSLAHEYRTDDLGMELRRSTVFDTADAAHDRLVEMIAQAEEDGRCEPGHGCGRCIDWPPQVYEVTINASMVSRETVKET
jgi:hypothetical protein